jgi:hypothetical protein
MIVDRRGHITAHGVTLERLAAELEVLAPYERFQKLSPLIMRSSRGYEPAVPPGDDRKSHLNRLFSRN